MATCLLQSGTPITFEITVKDCSNNPPTVITLSNYVSLLIKLRDPTGIVTTKVATLKTDGTDGIMVYTASQNEILSKGLWKIQGLPELPNGIFPTEVGSFTVVKNI